MLRLSKVDHGGPCRPGLVGQVSDALSRLLHPSNTQDCRPNDNKPLFLITPLLPRSSGWKRGDARYLFLNSSLETTSLLIRSLIFRYIPVAENVNINFNEKMGN